MSKATSTEVTVSHNETVLTTTTEAADSPPLDETKKKKQKKQSKAKTLDSPKPRKVTLPATKDGTPKKLAGSKKASSKEPTKFAVQSFDPTKTTLIDLCEIHSKNSAAVGGRLTTVFVEQAKPEKAKSMKKEKKDKDADKGKKEKKKSKKTKTG